MTPNEFADLVASVTTWIGDRALDENLDAGLNAKFPANGALFRSMVDACRAGIAADRLQDPNARYPLAGMQRLWSLATQETRDASCASCFVSEGTAPQVSLSRMMVLARADFGL